MDYCNLPTYKFEDLNEAEKEFYYDNLKNNN